jgi:hypothetical protein
LQHGILVVNQKDDTRYELDEIAKIDLVNHMILKRVGPVDQWPTCLVEIHKRSAEVSPSLIPISLMAKSAMKLMGKVLIKLKTKLSTDGPTE